MPILRSIINRTLRLTDEFRQHLQKSTLAEPNTEERILAEEFRTKMQALSIPGSEGMSPAQKAWNENMRTLQHLATTTDPRTFLSWDVVGGTMFVKYAKYSRTEYRYLRNLPDWHRWEEALKENEAGNPVRCPFDTTTSCNLLHHAYHLAQFEKFSNEDVAKYQFVMEFGGGYGSMCRLFYNLGFNGRYLIIDLPAFSILQEYFLKSIGIRVLSRKEFIAGEKGVFCVSDLDSLTELIGTERSLFLATWSISESPLFVREKVLGKFTNSFDAFLLAFQPKFEDVDNADYFERWRASHMDYSWSIINMEHLPKQKYLFGKRAHH